MVKIKTIFEIEIEIERTNEVKGKNRNVCMVFFQGKVKSELFTGHVLSGGCDTQLFDGNTKTLSARYILEGTDHDNNKCRIFIENNGIEKNGQLTTTPKIITDSPSLMYLEEASLFGKIASKNGKLNITIFEEKTNENQ